ncbi:MAG TPA: aminotransferase class I/II-fold pyridoxal phosphate-dependent enzyme [Actinomycetota bacterium]|nr:aminotransferase class I/II-fold pyridoxal phosphate-dependent enzyme [Actinomycetota bacterium]
MADVSTRIRELAELFRAPAEFFVRSQELKERFGTEACDFRAGDPHELATDRYVETLRRGAEPTGPDHFAYTQTLPSAAEAVAGSLRRETGLEYGERDVTMTNGAIAGIAVTVAAICDPHDEVIIVSPPHFLYEPLVRTQGARAVRVPMDRKTFDLDLGAIERALSPRTRAIIVNSPHNPTGRIYPRPVLDGLAELLTAASERSGRTVYLLSDEAYRRVLFDGRSFHPPAVSYRNTLTIYTYGKTLLAPGMRLGYVAAHPGIEDRLGLIDAIESAQLLLGWAFPNVDLQHVLPELEEISVDVSALQRRRDRMVEALRSMGYETHVPEATFYLVVRSPVPDDQAFTAMLGEEGVLVMPGRLLEMPGTIRLSLTASDGMVERSLAVFERVRKQVA